MKAKYVLLAIFSMFFIGCASTLTHYESGMQYYEAGKLDDAIEELQSSIAINPSDPVVHKALGDVFADKGMLLEAVTEWEVALKLRPAYDEVKGKLEASYLALGNDEYEKGKTDDAIALWKKCISFNDMNLEAHKRLGLAYIQNKDNDSAIPELEFVVSKNPNDDLIYKKLGIAYFERGDFDSSVRAFEALVKIKPTDAMAYNNLGSIQIKLKKFVDAIGVLEQAVKLDPTKPQIYNNLGSAYYGNKEYKKARAQWNKSLELNPLDKNAKENLKTLDSMGE
jgi:Flp pilus assembly protein TadD